MSTPVAPNPAPSQNTAQVIRHASAADIEAAINHPGVLSTAAPGYQALTVSPSDRRLAYGDERGVIVLRILPDGVFEWHWCLTPALRGAAALALGRAVIHEVFTRHKGRAIYGTTPRALRAARLMNRALGACPVDTVTLPDGREAIIYVLERSSWASEQLLGPDSASSEA